MSYKAAIFDMDGTILDTLVDLQNATNYGLSKNNLPERTYDEVRGFVGNGIRKLIERAVPAGSTEETIKKVHSDFTEFYKVHNSDHTAPYKGIPEAITQLRAHGIKTAVVSNKADYGVQALVKDFFPESFNIAVGEREGVAKKPSPDMVCLALNKLGISKEEAVYIGDSDVDFQTAANSGLNFIGVDWGFKGRAFLENLGAKTIVHNSEELINEILK